MIARKNKKSLVQRLVERHRQKITIVVDESPDRYLREQAQQRGWRLLNVWHSGGDVLPDVPYQGAFVKSLPDSHLVQKLLKKGCKVVRLGRLPHPMDNQVPAVLPDHAAYGRRAAEHFHERQFHDVAYVGRDPWSDMQPLYEGFKERAEQLGINCHLLRFKSLGKPRTSVMKYRQRVTVFGEWIRKLPLPIGLLAFCDYAAAELCFMIAQVGLDVPTDIAVLGLGNDVGLCEGAMTPISSFENFKEYQVRAACEMLENWLHEEAPPEEPVMIQPGAIVERESTRVLAVAHPVVARALRFIWDHFDEPMTVNDVAEAVAVSRSKLDRLFRQHFPRGVKEELNRKRLEKCRELLRNTDMKMAKVAAASGFRSAEYLREAFRKEFGIPPTQFRKQRQTGVSALSPNIQH